MPKSSVIFNEAHLVGSITKEVPDGVTLHDEGTYAAAPDSVKLWYAFANHELRVASSDESNQVSFRGKNNHFVPFWNTDIDETYRTVCNLVELAIPKAQEDGETIAHYGR